MMFKATIISILSLLIIVVVLLSANNFNFVDALAHGDVVYDIQVLPTFYRRVRVTYYGNIFTNTTMFALSNTSQCGNGGSIPDNLTDQVPWSYYDQSTYFVATFRAIGEAEEAYACVSNDTGATWYMAKNQKDRNHFRLWGRVPTTKISPTLPVDSGDLRVFVNNLPTGSRATLTTDSTACDLAVPTSIVPGGATQIMTPISSTTGIFNFTPTTSAAAVYVCVATPPTNDDWQLAPFDQTDSMIYRGWHYENVPDPTDMITGHMTQMSFRIYANTNANMIANIECNMPLIQGKTATCQLWILDSTVLINVANTDFAFQSLHDGAGIAECPTPSFAQDNASHVSFQWTPQRWGREGKLAILYQTLPVQMREYIRGQSVATFTLPNTTYYGDASFLQPFAGNPITKFLVLPGDTFSVDYAGQSNLLTDILSFSPLAPNFAVTRGVPDATSNSTLGYESLYMTLVPTVTSSVTSQTLAGIASKSRCKFNARYTFFPDTGFADQTQTTLVARASVISRDVSPADIEVLKNFYIYVQGNSLIVTGGDIVPLGITGDIRHTESLAFEFQWNSDQDGFRVEFEIFHDTQRRFYWSDPEFKCIPYGLGGETLAADVTALQNFYNDVIGIGKTTNLKPTWRNSADTGFNGDPCLKKWRGVICRNQRVVELQFDGLGFEGAIPTDVGSLSQLEVIRMAGNRFDGATPVSIATLTRLRTFDVSNNNLRSLPATFASSTTNLCLKRIFAQRNNIDAFPAQTIDHPFLESLRLEWNGMSGNMPNYTDPTVPLRELSCAHNQLSGWLPQSLPYQSLITFDMSDNKFDGPIPNVWKDFQNVQYLDISHNSFNGEVPHQLALIRSGNYLTFRAQDNYLYGLIPRLPFESYDLRQNIIACPSSVGEDFSNEHKLKGLLYDECDYSTLVHFT